jgi:hypothetical protein
MAIESITLLQDWNGRKAGEILPLCPRGLAKTLIGMKKAKLTESGEDVRHGVQTEPVEMSAIADKKQVNKPKAKRTRKKKPAK